MIVLKLKRTTMTSNPITVLLLIGIFVLLIMLYLGFGFLLCLVSRHEDEEHESRIDRIKIIFGWPRYMLQYIVKGNTPIK